MMHDREKAAKLLELLDTSVEAAEEMYRMLVSNSTGIFVGILKNLLSIYDYLEIVGEEIKLEGDGLNLIEAARSIKYSIHRIEQRYQSDVPWCLKKIEFELLPLIEDMRMRFYFWGCIYPDKNKIKQYYECEREKYNKNYYIQEAEKNGEYKYDLSISVIAFNKLEYTKLCLEYLLKNIPSGIKYELILINHGSTDGTKEYFEKINPNKQLDIAVNGGGMPASRIYEGKYTLQISNDVLVMESAIENLYACIESDERIAWVVPSTPNVSNLQDICLAFSDEEELVEASKKNNHQDLYRWEQRVRLCNPIDIRRNSAFEKIYGHFGTKNRFAFPDDLVSLLCRRNGYRLMLAKDAYCHHFGSITIKDEITKNKAEAIYHSGRKEFLEVFGVDPWGRGFCYDNKLFLEPIFSKTKNVTICGVNSGLGSNPLKIKEVLKEKKHNMDVQLYFYIQDARYKKDLESLTKEVMVFNEFFELKTILTPRCYDYIIVEDGIEDQKHIHNYLSALFNMLCDDGYLILKLVHKDTIRKIGKVFKGCKIIDAYQTGKWVYLKKE